MSLKNIIESMISDGQGGAKGIAKKKHRRSKRAFLFDFFGTTFRVGHRKVKRRHGSVRDLYLGLGPP